MSRPVVGAVPPRSVEEAEGETWADDRGDLAPLSSGSGWGFKIALGGAIVAASLGLTLLVHQVLQELGSATAPPRSAPPVAAAPPPVPVAPAPVDVTPASVPAPAALPPPVVVAPPPAPPEKPPAAPPPTVAVTAPPAVVSPPPPVAVAPAPPVAPAAPPVDDARARVSEEWLRAHESLGLPPPRLVRTVPIKPPAE